MAETLKDVIEKLKAKKAQEDAETQQAKQPKQKPVAIPEPQVAEEENLDENDEDDEPIEGYEEPVVEEKPVAKVQPTAKVGAPVAKQMTEQEKVLMQVEMFQNNGRFRLELLAQLQEINRALVVIAEALVDSNAKN